MNYFMTTIEDLPSDILKSSKSKASDREVLDIEMTTVLGDKALSLLLNFSDFVGIIMSGQGQSHV